ncbi:MAG: aspartate/glutamate racemase family protein [Bacteroidota bacterium]
MKTIGMIGGMSWESSKHYYELINKRTKELLGNAHSAKSMMVSVDFHDIEEFTFDGNWDQIGEMMAQSAEQLEQGGADFIILCTNTIHLVSDAITKNSTLPFLHIAHATGMEIRKHRLKKIGLLGTKFTMEKDFYTKILEASYGLEVITPKQEDRNTLNEIIYKELVNGQFTAPSKEKCLRMIQDLQNEGAEGVILGCTEIPLLVQKEDIPIPSFDTTKIHAYAAVNRALEEG